MNLVEKVQPSYQTGLVSNEYLLLNRPVWYEVGAYFLPDWSGKKAVLFSTRFILLTDKPTCIGHFQEKTLGIVWLGKLSKLKKVLNFPQFGVR